MVDFNCENCKAEITDYKNRVQVVELRSGMTHTYCATCGKDIQEKIRKSNDSIAETGKPGHLAGHASSGSSFRF